MATSQETNKAAATLTAQTTGFQPLSHSDSFTRCLDMTPHYTAVRGVGREYDGSATPRTTDLFPWARGKRPEETFAVPAAPDCTYLATTGTSSRDAMSESRLCP